MRGGRTLPLALVVLLAACGGADVIVTEEDGEGALYSSPLASWGFWYGGRHSGVGDTWTFGSVKLCLTDPGLRPVLLSVEPVSVTGQVEVERLAVRSALLPPPTDVEAPRGWNERHRGQFIIGAQRRIPEGLQEPGGWVVRTRCNYDTYWVPITEIVVTMTKTGPEGGGIEGIEVTYAWGDSIHRFTIRVGFGICGTRTPTCA